MKFASTGLFDIPKHRFEPAKIRYPENLCHELESSTYEEAKVMKNYNYIHNLEKVPDHNEKYLKQLYVESQGNLGQIRFVCEYPDRRDPFDELPLEKWKYG